MAKMIKEAFLGLPWVVSKFKNDADDGPSPYPLPQAGEGNKNPLLA
jgi:hypothetical protein